MKLTTSVVGGKLSGSSGNVTAASWKGRQYVRQRVVGKNPRKTDQVAQRLAWTKCVDCFQHILAPVKTFLDKIGSDRSISGFNVYLSTNVHDERHSFNHVVIPANRYADPIAGAAAAKGSAAGSITLTWDKESYTSSDKFIVGYRLHHPVAGQVPAYNDSPWTMSETAALDMADETFTITGLTQAQTYAVFIAPDKLGAGVYGGGAAFLQAAKET